MVKQLPKSIDAEKALLGAMIMYPDSIRIAFDQGLEEEDFYLDANRRVYRGILSLDEEKKPVDITSLTTRLNDMGMLGGIGGMDYLVQLVDMATVPANTDYYIELIQGKAILRRLIESANEISEEGMDRSFELDEVLDHAERKILQITRSRRTSDFQTTKDVVSNVIEQLQRLKNSSGVTGVATHFVDLDRLTNGFQKGDLIILAARPAMGKTGFALNIAVNTATYYENSVALFSLEMPAEQLVKRMLSGASRVEMNKLRDGRLSNQEWNMLFEGAEQIKKSKIFIDDSPSVKVSEIFSKCRKLKSEHGLDLVIIDYLQLIAGSKAENRQQEVSEISRSLKQLARELECPVLALSQLSRSVEQRGGNKRPMLSDLRESGSIEQDADLVIFLHSDDYYKDEKPPVRKINVIVAKHRNGATADVNLAFEPAVSTFSNYVSEGVIGSEE